MPEARSWQIGWWREAPPVQRRTVRFVAVSALAGLVAAGGAVGVAGPWEGGRRVAERERAAAGTDRSADREETRRPGRSAAPPVLVGAGERGAAREAAPDGLAAALEPLLKDPALGDRRSAAVYDAATGKRLYGSDEGTARTPASTIKLATAAAALSALGQDHRVDTTVVADGGDRIVLVGGGDPTLTARDDAASGPQRPASLKELARSTARALKARGKDRVEVGYDTSRYSGPALHPMGPDENIAPVSALMVDEGRLDDSDRGPAERSADPAADAAKKFAGLLRDEGVATDGDVTPRRAGDKAERLAAVSSPTVAALVERTLTNSDNDIAEALARQTALASGQEASFEGAARAVTARLDALGLPGARIADGSGLDRADQISADLLARLLVRAAEPGRPGLRPVLTGLPVAGFSGTLRGRYADEAAGRGLVRAKTGTLRGVNTLAGTVVDAEGRVVTFAFMASGTEDADAAQRALDRLAAKVADCGCRS
ncbi:D-alanyl-D-alanine carboxypeptidase/D-alanyl-D-alanine-endopeptidase [Streptomyces albireticuli]|nr:D-alanyl-D-alanine carboxypeptidase/D-alanyl-D-alanine-endopeptidase [Streptomyces albireticuli]MCD9145249.1 D-alanyl-D-alanine carboxypeptidase/D-alanyl-D-alanine-endopeptidase [Streptomyces albireticuli]MCD9164576.1 D-alanyl-D-alanine carboxypeptidase/D-alanyl-D-alanine-endopeptidase [Streptomyces albireticuli]MCD9194841.1 D-alanyl-D-alanine carboxypeptidase/D-alanyl-D-alanine-endopeptidase [Streptomyces albireticuli]